MKLLVAGSRNIKEFDLEKHVPDGVTMIITGGADGIDTLAELYADKKRLSKLILRPQYNMYGRGAPLRRNEKMVELCDVALIVWDGSSKGTQHTICYAEKSGKKVILITKDMRS
jgi:predicted Rossmann fold nucleotide-binding protein DprA/Smf involved in DNA uptake